MAVWKRPPEQGSEPDEQFGSVLQGLIDGAFVQGLREGDPVMIGATVAAVAAVATVIFLALRASRDRPRSGGRDRDRPRHMRR